MNHPKTKGIVTFYSQDNNAQAIFLTQSVQKGTISLIVLFHLLDLDCRRLIYKSHTGASRDLSRNIFYGCFLPCFCFVQRFETVICRHAYHFQYTTYGSP
nr:MAG TPA: hypothetical protein [Caudoviricetes sp.]